LKLNVLGFQSFPVGFSGDYELGIGGTGLDPIIQIAGSSARDHPSGTGG
jgi:hypothetical protein